jgi:hypothetical protein
MDLDFVSPQDYEVSLRRRPFSPTDTDWDYFDVSFQEIYENPNSVYLHRGFYLFRYLSISETDFEAVWIRGTQVITASRESRAVLTFDSFEEVKPCILRYFPMIPRAQVEAAVRNYTHQVIPLRAPAHAQ